MSRFRVTFIDNRMPPKIGCEEIEVEMPLSGEAIEVASAIFFTKYAGELHKNFTVDANLLRP